MSMRSRSSRGALALEAALDPRDGHAFPVVWRGDWIKYTQMYMEQVTMGYVINSADAMMGNTVVD